MKQSTIARENSSMAWVSLIIYLYIPLFINILKTEEAVEQETRVLRATAPGDIIIVGVFSVHEDVDKKNNSFAPQKPSCIR